MNLRINPGVNDGTRVDYVMEEMKTITIRL